MEGWLVGLSNPSATDAVYPARVHHLGVGELYYLIRPPSDVRFAKVLAEATDSIYVRPFTEPPELRWWTDPGVPMVWMEPQPGDHDTIGHATPRAGGDALLHR